MNKSKLYFRLRNTRRRRVLFIAEHIKQPHGSALSAIDVLRSIPSSYKKYILTDHPIAEGTYLHKAVRRSWNPPLLSDKPYRLSQIASKVFARLYSPLIHWWLRNVEFDVVVVNGFGSHSLWQKVRHFIPSPTTSALISRESPRHFDSSDRAHTLAEQIEFLQSFKVHIFVSNRLKDEWIISAGLGQAQTYYLPNCCEENEFLSIARGKVGQGLIREEYEIPADIPLVLNVGSIELRKGQEDLEQLAWHLEKTGQDFRIACVGFAATEEGSRFLKRIQNSRLRGLL